MNYWRSLDEYYGHAEADPGATDTPGNAHEDLDEPSRRRMLQLLGASLALAGSSACTRQPPEFIVPYVEPPERVIPGRPLYFATAAPVNGIAQGVIVETHAGRPTKIEGNPDHPASLGASSVHAQSSVLDLYDPDRSKEITHLGETRSWDAFQNEMRLALDPIRARQGEGFYILTERVVSPSLGAKIEEVLAALPRAKWHQYDPAGMYSAHAGAQLAFARPVNTIFDLSAADIVVSLDADFLACGPASTRYAHDFAERRRRGGRLDMNRLYAIESTMTATGGKADHRLPLRHRDVVKFAEALAASAGASGAAQAGSAPYSGFLDAMARDLQSHRGASAIIAGDDQPPAVHAWAHAINAALGNTGRTVKYTEALDYRPVDRLQSLKELLDAMNGGAVELLFILGGNPVYNAPADFQFSDALLKRVKTSVRVGLHQNETSVRCHWHVPESHFLEEWGDARAYDGTVTLLQPAINPLYESHSHATVLDSILAPPGRNSYEILRAYWSGKHKGADFEAWWRKSVHDGLIEGSALPTVQAAIKPAFASGIPAQSSEGFELAFRTDPYIYDGRFANNTWLQELPHPLGKLTWDNAVHLSPATAARLNIENQDNVELIYRGRSVSGSVWITPGNPDDSATIYLGYGRSNSGRAGNGAGFSAYLLRDSAALWSGGGLEIRKTGRSYPLATTQQMQIMHGRDLVISNTVNGYKENPAFVREKQPRVPQTLSLYPQWDYKGYAWGMSIDLTACVNCNACVVACQAENNIPVVGKEQVLARRAMHWLRIDTYYEGDPANPSVYYQPVPCMQCENAPCELVCPVQATNHSSDGLNDMVYNRCIGTRYCSNNCPYKVRRFNFLLFQDWSTETLKLQRNPDVSVRSRGVMEKCTYCVQRIREAEIRSMDQDRGIRDGEVQTACAQACPTQAIVFGDANGASNRVARLKAEPLDYHLLAELNTRPRTTYLAELRNPNPDVKEAPRGDD